MSREEETFEPIGDESNQYVPAVFAHSPQEAEYYRDLLSDHDIPAVIGSAEEESDDGPSISRGVPVLVPDPFLDEASEIIADREDLDEFEDEQEDEEEDDEELELEDDAEEDDEEKEDEEEDEKDEKDDFLEDDEDEDLEELDEEDEEEDEEEEKAGDEEEEEEGEEAE